MTHVSFSDNVIDITLPQGWRDLTQKELQSVYQCMSVYTDDTDDVRLMIFLRLTGVKLITHLNGKYKFSIKSQGDEKVFWLSPESLISVVENLDWIFMPGSYPVRLDVIGKGKAIDACLHGIPFSDYLKIENLFQGYLTSKDVSVIKKLESILYPGIDNDSDDDISVRTINVLNWLSQIKNLFSVQFPHLFKKSSAEGEAPNMLELMNNQIRILTGGDLTKEPSVLSSDCWRALTELDYKAMEAEELRQNLKRK